MGNNINSTIPSNICKDEAFRNLEQLELSKNELIIGTLPDSLKYCTNLSEFLWFNFLQIYNHIYDNEFIHKLMYFSIL